MAYRFTHRVDTRVSGPLAALLVLALTGCGAVTTSHAPAAAAASATRSSYPSPSSEAPSDNPASPSSQAPSDNPASSARLQPPSPSPCSIANPTVMHPLVEGGTLPGQASASPSAAMAVVFGLSSVDAQNYFVSIVDLTGKVVASAKAHLRSQVTGTCGNDFTVYPAMPLISTSAGRAYYLDGDTDVRYLAPDGSTGFATSVPGNSQSVAMFAVSPDDQKIAVAVFDYRSHPVASRLYVENLNGGGNHVDLPASDLPYRWPVGWHDGNLVVGATSSASPAFGFYGPLPYSILEFQELDPATGQVIVTLGSSTCAPQSSLPTHGGVACETQKGAVGVIDWSGKTTLYASGDVFTGGASVSPDGTQVATSGSGAILKLISSPATGSTESDIGGGYPSDGGWLDAEHVVVRGGASESIVDITTHTYVGLPAQTVLAARLPGGF